MYRTLNCLPLSARRHYHWLHCIFKCIHFISNNIQHYTYPHTHANELRILIFLFLKLTKKLAVMLFNFKHLLTRTICSFKGAFARFGHIFWLKHSSNELTLSTECEKTNWHYVQDAMYCITNISTPK